MITYKCRFCGADMESPQSMAGKTETCPSCRKPQTVPTAEIGAAAHAGTAKSAVGLASYTSEVFDVTFFEAPRYDIRVYITKHLFGTAEIGTKRIVVAGARSDVGSATAAGAVTGGLLGAVIGRILGRAMSRKAKYEVIPGGGAAYFDEKRKAASFQLPSGKWLVIYATGKKETRALMLKAICRAFGDSIKPAVLGKLSRPAKAILWAILLFFPAMFIALLIAYALSH